MSLFERRLSIVTGKGGVGKSTVAAALALAAQKEGKRVLVCEVTAKERVAALLGAPDSGPDVRQIDRNIWSVHVQPPTAMREYGLMVLRFKLVYDAVFENRLVKYLLRAIPSLPEIVMLGKVWWHVCEDRDESGRLRWDHVVLDAPATGHGISFLGTPRTILELVSEGPIVRDMKRMQEMLVDPKTTAIHVVTLPEEMPVNEAIELNGALRDLQLPRGRVVMNGFVAPRFSEEERGNLSGTDGHELGPARTASQTYGERQDLSSHYAQRLATELDLPSMTLPWVAVDTFGRPQIEQFADALREQA